jgi:hypothetical protein
VKLLAVVSPLLWIWFLLSFGFGNIILLIKITFYLMLVPFTNDAWGLKHSINAWKDFNASQRPVLFDIEAFKKTNSYFAGVFEELFIWLDDPRRDRAAPFVGIVVAHVFMFFFIGLGFGMTESSPLDEILGVLVAISALFLVLGRGIWEDETHKPA